MLGLGALSALAQIVTAFAKALPAFVLTLLSGVVLTTCTALYVLAFPVTMPYAIYKAKGKWSAGARILVSVLYVILMLLTGIIMYFTLKTL